MFARIICIDARYYVQEVTRKKGNCMNEELERFKEKYQINQFVCLYSERGVEQLAEIISCRVQLAQYELLRERGKSISWEDYVYQLAASEDMQAKARRAAIEAERDFSAFTFDGLEKQKRKDGQTMLAVKLFRGEAARGIVILFAFRAELTHYKALLKERGAEYTLAQYMQELWMDDNLAAAQREGFEQAVDLLDFKAAWKRVGYEFF